MHTGEQHRERTRLAVPYEEPTIEHTEVIPYCPPCSQQSLLAQGFPEVAASSVPSPSSAVRGDVAAAVEEVGVCGKHHVEFSQVVTPTVS